MLRFASILIVCMLAQTAASGGTVEISGSGTWDSTAPSTALSAAGKTWSFSFDVNVTTPIENLTTLSVSNPLYLLNGTPVVSETINTVQFFTTAAFGLFNLGFSGGSLPDELNFYGVQVFDASGNLAPGTYQAAIDINGLAGAPPASYGSGAVIVGGAPVVPEPSSIISGGIAVLALGGLGLVRRRFAA